MQSAEGSLWFQQCRVPGRWRCVPGHTSGQLPSSWHHAGCHQRGGEAIQPSQHQVPQLDRRCWWIQVRQTLRRQFVRLILGSQGSAVIADAVSTLSSAADPVGVSLFGYTLNDENNGRIPNYPTGNTQVLCNIGDGVCGPTLVVTAAHLTYAADGSVPRSVSFLAGKIGN